MSQFHNFDDYDCNNMYLQCDRTVSLNGFLDNVLEKCNSTQGGQDLTLLGVIGCGCTEATLPIAEIIHRWNIPLVDNYTIPIINL